MRGVKMGLGGFSVCVCSAHARGCGVSRGRRVLYGRADARLGQSERDVRAIVREIGAFDELSQEIRPKKNLSIDFGMVPHGCGAKLGRLGPK